MPRMGRNGGFCWWSKRDDVVIWAHDSVFPLGTGRTIDVMHYTTCRSCLYPPQPSRCPSPWALYCPASQDKSHALEHGLKRVNITVITVAFFPSSSNNSQTVLTLFLWSHHGSSNSYRIPGLWLILYSHLALPGFPVCFSTVHIWWPMTIRSIERVSRGYLKYRAWIFQEGLKFWKYHALNL